MLLLEWGIKYRTSKNVFLRWLAELCISWEKLWTECVERRLKKQNVRSIDKKAAEAVLQNIKQAKNNKKKG